MSPLPDQAGAEEVLLIHLPAEDLTAAGAENFNKINYKKEIYFIYLLFYYKKLYFPTTLSLYSFHFPKALSVPSSINSPEEQS